MHIINLTRTRGIPGVLDFNKQDFDNIVEPHLDPRRAPSPEAVYTTAETLAELAKRVLSKYSRRSAALLEGPPYLLGELESSLMERDIEPVYACNYEDHEAEVIKGTIELIRPRKR